MNSRFKTFEQEVEVGNKRKYIDKTFKKQLTKSLKLNRGEPDNIDKIRGNRHLQTYPEEKIVEFVNSVAKDVQKNVEKSTDDPEAEKAFKLASFMSNVCYGKKPQELPLVMKLKSQSPSIPATINTKGVDFKELHQFLYSAVSGLPDTTDLNEASLKVLHEAHELLMEQVNRDASPEFLEELKSKISSGSTETSHAGVGNLAKVFQDSDLNPLDLPFQYLLRGSLPAETEPDEPPQKIVPSKSDKKI